MASRATWRTVTGDPRSRWFAQESRRWTTLALKRASIGVAALASYALLIKALGAFSLLVLAVVALRRALPARWKAPEAASPAPGVDFQATVAIRRKGALLIEDEAVVTFVEGWLHVEGNRTAFALSSLDLGAPLPRPAWQMLTGLLSEIPLAVRIDSPLDPETFCRVDLSDGTAIRFAVLPGWQEQARFEQRLRAWRVGEIACGESTLPPDRPHPSTKVRVATDAFVAVLGLSVVIGVIILFGLAWGAVAWAMIPGQPIHQAIVEVVRQRRMGRQR